MVNSVEEKMTMTNIMPSKKNDTKMNKTLGRSGSEIKYLGKSNQKIRRKLG
jgi:phosphoribosylaminoimidazole carboxylase (NCAIR synthetase)